MAGGGGGGVAEFLQRVVRNIGVLSVHCFERHATGGWVLSLFPRGRACFTTTPFDRMTS